MTDTDIRVQLAKKLGWDEVVILKNGEVVGHQPGCSGSDKWKIPLPSLYDLCLDGEERLTKEQQSVYLNALFGTEVSDRAIFAAIRLSNLPERAKVLIEVLP